MTIKITVLGCGASLGVPALGFGWGDCDPDNPKNNRTRPSVLLQKDGFNLLVDSGPDVRHQLVRENIRHIDAVFYTHEHADHTHGIDDLRGYMLTDHKPLDIHSNARTIENLKHRFGYFFAGDSTAFGRPRAIGLIPHEIPDNAMYKIGPFKLQTFVQPHGGRYQSLGFRVGGFGYSTDVSELSGVAKLALDGVNTWIVDANNRTPEDGDKHADVKQAIAWVNKVGARQAYLTHLPAWHDYEALKAQCPSHVEPAYDGLTFTVQD